jgi:hypothetical protein
MNFVILEIVGLSFFLFTEGALPINGRTIS